jgi:hypothetical protein
MNLSLAAFDRLCDLSTAHRIELCPKATEAETGERWNKIPKPFSEGFSLQR